MADWDPEFSSVLDAALNGDGDAFAQIYNNLNRRVHAFARVRGATDPEGLVNDVFLQVFTRLGTFEGSEPQFGAWVFAITRNKLIDEHRRRTRRVTEVGGLDTVSEAESRPSPEDVAAQAIDHIHNVDLARRLEALTAEQRDAVLLRVVGDLSIESIAEVLGKRPGAVKALLRRAFRTIARLGLWKAVSL